MAMRPRGTRRSSRCSRLRASGRGPTRGCAQAAGRGGATCCCGSGGGGAAGHRSSERTGGNARGDEVEDATEEPLTPVLAVTLSRPCCSKPCAARRRVLKAATVLEDPDADATLEVDPGRPTDEPANPAGVWPVPPLDDAGGGSPSDRHSTNSRGSDGCRATGKSQAREHLGLGVKAAHGHPKRDGQSEPLDRLSFISVGTSQRTAEPGHGSRERGGFEATGRSRSRRSRSSRSTTPEVPISQSSPFRQTPASVSAKQPHVGSIVHSGTSRQEKDEVQPLCAPPQKSSSTQKSSPTHCRPPSPHGSPVSAPTHSPPSSLIS